MLWKAVNLLLLALLFLLLPLRDCVRQELFSNSVWNEATIYDFIEDDIFFEILYPKELGYTYRLRQAKNFGTPFERIFKGIRLVLADPWSVAPCPTMLQNSRERWPWCPGVSDGLHTSGDAHILPEYGFFMAKVKDKGCSFVSKAVKAEQAGALAVIVMDNDKDNDEMYVEMVEDNTNRKPNIPAGFLLGRSGYMIARTLRDEHEEAAIINIPVNMTSVPFHKLNQPPWILW